MVKIGRSKGNVHEVQKVANGNIRSCGAGDSVEVKATVDTGVSSARSVVSKDWSGSTITYPEQMENAILEADRVLTRYLHVFNNRKSTQSTNSVRAKIVNYLKDAIQILNDYKHIKLTESLNLELCSIQSPDGERLYRLQQIMELNECSADAMTKYIIQATERLKCDFAWLSSAKDTNCKRSGQLYSKVPTVLVFDTNPRTLTRASPDPDKDSVSDSIQHKGSKTCEETAFTRSRSWTELLDADCDNFESPRERFARKIKQHGFDCDGHEGDKSKHISTDELSTNLLAAIGTVRRKVRKEVYDSLSRQDRTLAMRLDLMKSLRPHRLIHILLRAARRFLSRTDGKLLSPCSSTMADILLATMTSYGAEHVKAYLKNVLAVFLGSEKEAVIARQEYYALWTFTLRDSRKKSSNRWRTYVTRFARGEQEFSRLIDDMKRTTGLLCELLTNRLISQTQYSCDETTKNEIAIILKKYARYVVSIYTRYQIFLLEAVGENFLTALASGNASIFSAQMRLIDAPAGLQTFQDACLNLVDVTFWRTNAPASPRSKEGAALMKHLAAQVLLLSTKRFLQSSFKCADSLIASGLYQGLQITDMMRLCHGNCFPLHYHQS